MPSPSKKSDQSVLAEAIVGLSYGDMMELCRLFMDMVEDSKYDLETPEGMADLLHTWAESKIESDEEEE